MGKAINLNEQRNNRALLGFWVQEDSSPTGCWKSVQDAFLLLIELLEPHTSRGRPVIVNVTGHLGFSFSLDTGPNITAVVAARKVYTRWITQAVQAEAAMIPQLILFPTCK